jgi:hypothetical protein
LPRALPPPEHNIIQNPKVTRGVQRFAGVRQAHVMPALSDGMNATMLTGDIREDPRTGLPESYASLLEVIPDAANVKRAVFVNPLDSDRVAVLRRLHVYAAEDYATTGVSLVYSWQPQTGYVFTVTALTRGVRLTSGYDATVMGLPPPTPPIGLDIPFPTRQSTMGWHTPPFNGIDGAYFWRGVLSQSRDILEEFRPYSGPRFMVFPGGTFHGYILDANAHAYWNLWWDEYPLT